MLQLLLAEASTLLLSCSALLRNPATAWEDVPHLPKAACALLDESFSRCTSKVGGGSCCLTGPFPQRSEHPAVPLGLGCRC